MSIRRGAEITLASGLALIVLFAPVRAGDTVEIFFEDFEDGTPGQDLTDLGWRNLCDEDCGGYIREPPGSTVTGLNSATSHSPPLSAGAKRTPTVVPITSRGAILAPTEVSIPQA